MACPLNSYHDIESPSKRLGHGQVQVIFGPMFSGKTTELIRRLKRYQVANHRCLIIKYANDNRYADKDISTHDRQTLAAVSATKLEPLKSIAASSYSVIGIDEGQFFPDCVPFAEELANLGKIVIVAALDATFQRQAFGDILSLVPIAENVVKLNAVCMECFRTASYTKRKGSEQQVEVIGGTDKYLAVCRKCYFGSSPLNGNGASVAPEIISPVKKALFNGAS
ncbi:thymidine kinase, cytosolic-like isoform X1 [Amphibalanus amphitrite]|uniref:thymidine kinase, cytosolic-like isoform X1 n=1 Tax=Amphibalanus amphitrite TaxID=1232801 RepID=UPI001C8FD6E0|nr:thymidine kinase, cytosolic-like isoform X1 [Amphibalanus amphitrite]XP_043198909.1 thymidine kinase, cytosolic-like isoform X1 [Amphibalanus amphitrite]